MMTTSTDVQPPAQEQKTRNTVGLIALITAIVGAVFAVIPGALIIGWILLPIAFVLSILSLFLKGQPRGQGIAALVISILGTIIGFIVFFAVVGTAIDDAFSEETEVQAPQASDAADDGEAAPAQDEPAEDADQGTRDNPLPLGATISTDEWDVTVNSVDLDATDALTASPLNDSPAEGHGYILINMTATYTGTDPEGATPWATVEFVSSTGNSYDSLDAIVITEDSFDSLETLYEGASTSGDKALEVPLDDLANGTLRVSADLFADDQFFAVR